MSLIGLIGPIGLISPISLIGPISPPLISLKITPASSSVLAGVLFFLKNDCYSDNFP